MRVVRPRGRRGPDRPEACWNVLERAAWEAPRRRDSRGASYDQTHLATYTLVYLIPDYNLMSSTIYLDVHSTYSYSYKYKAF